MTRGCATSLRRTLAPACVGARALAGCGGAPSAEDLRAQAGEQWPFLERYCYECHNETDLTADIAFDALSPRRDRGARRHVRARRAQVARPHDAAAGRRRAEQRRNGRLRGVARGDARCGSADAGARLRHAASHESHRVRERNPRSAGARGRSRDAVARRWRRARLRQHRERAHGVAVVHRSILERRAQSERAGDRQRAAARRRRAVHDRQRARRSSSTSTACRSARAAAR